MKIAAYDYSPRLNVGQFLAGDGITDDGPKMRALIRSGIYAGIKNFYLPAGTYLVGEDWFGRTFPAGVSIIGSNRITLAEAIRRATS